MYSIAALLRVNTYMVKIIEFPPALPSLLYLVWPERPHVSGNLSCTNKKGEYRFPHTPLTPTLHMTPYISRDLSRCRRGSLRQLPLTPRYFVIVGDVYAAPCWNRTNFFRLPFACSGLIISTGIANRYHIHATAYSKRM